MIRSAFLLAALLVLASCACEAPAEPGDSGARRDGAPGVDTGVPSACGSARTRVTGTVFAPNGVDPIPGVLVYAARDDQVFPPPPATVQCQRCVGEPVGSLGRTHSGRDGTFALSSNALDAGGTFTIVVETGGFRHVERGVVVDACSTVALSGAQTSLPGASSGDDTIPRIAVASSDTADVWDQFAHVLDLIGITGYERVDPDRSGAPDGMLALLADRALLDQYQIVIAPCGALGGFSVSPNLTPTIVANVQDWLAAGGRLYASDLAYAIIQRPFPSAMTFATGPSPRAGADPADVGVGISGTLDATVEDSELLDWLQLVGAVPAGSDTIPVRDFRDPWGAIDFVPPASLVPDATGYRRAVVWVSGDVAWHTPGGGRHPLTVQADHPGAGGSCGRVVYTSYHVESGDDSTLSPQERVLEYLFFQLSSCIPDLI